MSTSKCIDMYSVDGSCLKFARRSIAPIGYVARGRPALLLGVGTRRRGPRFGPASWRGGGL